MTLPVACPLARHAQRQTACAEATGAQFALGYGLNYTFAINHGVFGKSRRCQFSDAFTGQTRAARRRHR